MSSDVHTLSGAYALDALTPEEAEEFAQHLARCESCRVEVREIEEAAARMGAAEAKVPPPELKPRVLAAIDRTPQLRPRTAEQGTAARSSVPSRRTGGPRRWLTWVGSAAAAVVLIGIGVV